MDIVVSSATLNIATAAALALSMLLNWNIKNDPRILHLTAVVVVWSVIGMLQFSAGLPPFAGLLPPIVVFGTNVSYWALLTGISVGSAIFLFFRSRRPQAA